MLNNWENFAGALSPGGHVHRIKYRNADEESRNFFNEIREKIKPLKDFN